MAVKPGVSMFRIEPKDLEAYLHFGISAFKRRTGEDAKIVVLRPEYGYKDGNIIEGLEVVVMGPPLQINYVVIAASKEDFVAV